LRAETAVTLKWIAKELRMAAWTHVANLLRDTQSDEAPDNQHELNFV